jgi:gentisate 1,2-dioxygenase
MAEGMGESTAARGEKLAQRNLFAELMALRDQQREQRQGAVWLIKGNTLPLEENPLGKMRWYLHPALDDTAIKTLLFFVEEIAPGGRSGRLQFQGGQVIYVWQGRGHTLLDGVRHPWEAGDVINLPLRTEGITVQHFNDGDDLVKLVCAEANLVHALGVDRGVGYEVLENARD